MNGVLATTRGLGNHGDLSLKKCVISTPHTSFVTVDQYCQLLILASNGVWEVFSDHEAAALLLQVDILISQLKLHVYGTFPMMRLRCSEFVLSLVWGILNFLVTSNHGNRS